MSFNEEGLNSKNVAPGLHMFTFALHLN